MGETTRPLAPLCSIFEDAGEYVPEVNAERSSSSKHGSSSRRDGAGEHERGERKRSSYFEKPSLEDERAAAAATRGSASGGHHRSHDTRWSNASDGPTATQLRDDSGRLKAKLTSKLERDLPESYAECYPG